MTKLSSWGLSVFQGLLCKGMHRRSVGSSHERVNNSELRFLFFVSVDKILNNQSGLVFHIAQYSCVPFWIILWLKRNTDQLLYFAYSSLVLICICSTHCHVWNHNRYWALKITSSQGRCRQINVSNYMYTKTYNYMCEKQGIKIWIRTKLHPTLSICYSSCMISNSNLTQLAAYSDQHHLNGMIHSPFFVWIRL